MLLRKIDGEMNVQNGGFSAILRSEDGGDMLHDWQLHFYVYLHLRDRNCYSAADGNGSCHAPAPSYFEEMTCCWHQNLRWRWPDNPNGRSLQLTLFTFTRSQVTLLRWRRDWWRLPEIAQTARSWRQKYRQERPGSIEIPQIYAYEIKQNVSKNLFLPLRMPPLLCIVHCFFLLSLATAVVLTYNL